MAVQGISVDVANSGHQALERLLQAGPDEYGLVLMDLEMPGMDGHEATIELRRDRRFNKLPIIAMTAHALSEIRDRCLREGMQDYITKPVDPAKLYGTLARWLGHAMPPRAAPSVRDNAAIPGLAAIDSALGLRHVAGNMALYLQLLERVRSSQRSAAAEIRGEFDAGRNMDASKRAHTLRGVAGNIGARELQALAQAVEQGLRMDGADRGQLAMRIDALSASLAQVFDALDAYFAQPGAASVPVRAAESVESAADALAHLQSLLAEFSGETNDYFDTVRTRVAGVLDAATFDRLATHLSRYEFDEARRLLADAAVEGSQ
jgi:two-component system sensor histidine kinase/response regulator